ncbi:hypothetical protein [Paraferrimonas sp. SM1919]|uniref:hypothetical protein n=1 Tax=Paraferrimonas sp. SM1919 TaxID=2662263 RepID=UPI0013D14CDE|nr:hypothetical protein [Paraferrimonas sp. SM1919]
MYSPCGGSVTEGNIFVYLESSGLVRIGEEIYSKDLFLRIHEHLSETCESVAVMLVADTDVAHKQVYELKTELESLKAGLEVE